MRAEDIRKRLRHRPFKPIRICRSDGTCYEVHHPENAVVAEREVYIATDFLDGDDVPGRLVYCDPLHVTRIEPLTNGRRKKAAKKRKRRGS